MTLNYFFFSLLKVELWWQRYLNVLQTILWVMIIFVILWYSLCTTDKWINGCIYVKTSLTPMAILKAQIYILTTLHQNPLTNNCWQNKLLVIVPSLNRVWLWPPWTAAHDSPILHYLQKFALTHVHWVYEAAQSGHPLSPISPTFNPSQHEDLFQWVSSVWLSQSLVVNGEFQGAYWPRQCSSFSTYIS